MANKTISILGCGWLGFPLAKRLRQQNFAVKGSTTNQGKFSLLKGEGIAPYILKCDPHLVGQNLQEFFQSDILVITIPFKRSLSDPRDYHTQVQSIISRVKDSTVKFLIFTSSTSIYPQGITVAHENTPILPTNDRSKVLYAIEEELRQNDQVDTTIVRLGGLYDGEDRKIGKFLSGKVGLTGGQHPVNLIHRDDCVNILYEIIRQDVRNEIFNAVSDEHPPRAELYAKVAKFMGATPPVFSEDAGALNKIVDNGKLKEKLNYHFLHPDPSDFQR